MLDAKSKKGAPKVADTSKLKAASKKRKKRSLSMASAAQKKKGEKWTTIKDTIKKANAQSMSTGLDDTTAAGVRRNPTRTARNVKTIPNVAAPVHRVRKQPKTAVRPDEVKVIDWRKWYDEKSLTFKEKKPEGKGAIDLLDFTLPSTNQSVMFKDVQKLANDNFYEHQTNLNKGVTYWRKEYGLPKQKDFDEQMKRLNSASQKVNISKQKKDMEKVITTAMLWNIHKVKAISWTPSAITASGGPVKNADGTLKRKYYCRYENDFKKMKDTVVVTNWAERHFSVVAFAYAQKFAYSKTKVELVKDNKGHNID